MGATNRDVVVGPVSLPGPNGESPGVVGNDSIFMAVLEVDDPPVDGSSSQPHVMATTQCHWWHREVPNWNACLFSVMPLEEDFLIAFVNFTHCMLDVLII